MLQTLVPLATQLAKGSYEFMQPISSGECEKARHVLSFWNLDTSCQVQLQSEKGGSVTRWKRLRVVDRIHLQYGCHRTFVLCHELFPPDI